MRDISKNIKQLRQEKGLTQDELAEKLHVTRQAVSNWETDKNHPDIEILMNMAELFEVDIKELLYRPAKKQNDRRRWLVIGCELVSMVILWAVILCVGQIANEIRRNTFVLGFWWWYHYFLLSFGFLFSGLAAAVGIRQWRDLYVRDRRARRALLVLALIPPLLFWIPGFTILGPHIFGVRIQIPYDHLWRFYILPNPWLCLPSGFIFGCLLPKPKHGAEERGHRLEWWAFILLLLTGLGAGAMMWLTGEMVALSRGVPFQMSEAEWLLDWLKAMMFFCFGGSGAVFLGLKKELRPKTGKGRAWLLAVVVGLLALLVGGVIFAYAIRQGKFLGYPVLKAIGRWLLTWDGSFLFVLPGFLLFYALSPKREQRVDFPTDIL